MKCIGPKDEYVRLQLIKPQTTLNVLCSKLSPSLNGAQGRLALNKRILPHQARIRSLEVSDSESSYDAANLQEKIKSNEKPSKYFSAWVQANKSLLEDHSGFKAVNVDSSNPNVISLSKLVDITLPPIEPLKLEHLKLLPKQSSSSVEKKCFVTALKGGQEDFKLSFTDRCEKKEVSIAHIAAKAVKTLDKIPENAGITITFSRNESLSFFILDDKSRLVFLDPDVPPKEIPSGKPARIYMQSMNIKPYNSQLHTYGLPGENREGSTDVPTELTARIFTDFEVIKVGKSQIEVHAETPIESLKESLFQTFGIEPSNQKVTIDKLEAADGRTLQSYGFSESTKVDMTAKTFSSLKLVPISVVTIVVCTESVYKEIIGVSTHKGKEKEEGSEGVLNDSASQHEKGDSQDDSEDAMEVDKSQQAQWNGFKPDKIIRESQIAKSKEFVYQVTWVDRDVDDAKWLTGRTLTKCGMGRLVRRWNSLPHLPAKNGIVELDEEAIRKRPPKATIPQVVEKPKEISIVQRKANEKESVSREIDKEADAKKQKEKERENAKEKEKEKGKDLEKEKKKEKEKETEKVKEMEKDLEKQSEEEKEEVEKDVEKENEEENEKEKEMEKEEEHPDDDDMDKMDVDQSEKPSAPNNSDSPFRKKVKEEALKVTFDELMKQRVVVVGQKVRYLNEIGTVRRDGWIEYHNQSLNSMPAFVDEVHKVKKRSRGKGQKSLTDVEEDANVTLLALFDFNWEMVEISKDASSSSSFVPLSEIREAYVLRKLREEKEPSSPKRPQKRPIESIATPAAAARPSKKAKYKDDPEFVKVVGVKKVNMPAEMLAWVVATKDGQVQMMPSMELLGTAPNLFINFLESRVSPDDLTF